MLREENPSNDGLICNFRVVKSYSQQIDKSSGKSPSRTTKFSDSQHESSFWRTDCPRIELKEIFTGYDGNNGYGIFLYFQ